MEFGLKNATPRLIIDLGRVLYIGPWGEAAEHTPMVPIVGAGLDGDIHLVIDGESFTGRTVHVPSGVARSVNAFGGRLAVMPFDPVHATTGQIHEGTTLRALERLSNDVFDAATWQELAKCAGLRPLGEISRTVKEAAAFLETHHDENVPAEQVAASVGYSLSHLQDLFRTQLGVSMRSYRSWSRLRRTAELMTSAPTITDAAIRAGFYDAAHFTRTFVATFGVVPSDVFTANLDLHVVDNPV